ncbi:hypothetical protein [Sporosarcina sp. 6E9]|uniref:hypothetical protein n=1 Tax=Sporosarcina sp. 6E9 TaxID=2819235 RepID=UPI001AC8EA40|nr:hypothetical protein [Sporosarcina sp. 6E9]MBO1909723.1 hypothetical protein [Microvirga sp. 3-52]
MAINVYGNAVLKARFSVELDMTEEEFEALTEHQKDNLVDSKIDWHNAMQGAEVDEMDIWEYREIKK